MAILKDEEEQKGQGTSQVLGQGMAQPQQEAAQPEQPQTPSSGPATIGGSSATQASAPVKAMPKQQKAGTGTFANLKSYLQAAQGGGQQKVAQAATQQVQRLGAGAQKATQQAQKAFGTQMEAGSLKGMQTAGQEAADIIGAARGVTYQAPQPVPTEETTPRRGINPPTQIKPYDLEATALFWQDKIINPDGTVTYKDGRPLEGKTLGDAVKSGLIQSTEPTIPVPTQPAQPQAPVAQQYFTPEQQQRFAEIINAQYQGPQSIQQAGLYEPAAQKARTAEQAGQLTQTALGREQLLRDVFGRGRDYSRGASRLDALLLNASEQGVQQLQQQAQPALQAQQSLQAAQNLSANEAANRVAAIEQIRSGARKAFTEGRAAEEQATEKRIDDLIKTPVVDESGKPIQKMDATGKPLVDAGGNPVYMTEWDRLPEYFRGILRDSSKGQVQLSPEELAILGVQSGEGIYNLGQGLIQDVAAERNRLITKDELSRQLALQQLAGLDVSKELQKDLLYSDLEKAGTQDLSSSLNVENIRNQLKGAQEGFKTAAEGATLVGTGKKKVSRGNALGKKTKTYYAEQAGNVADMLREAGYDVSKLEPSEVNSLLENKDLLNKYLGATSTSRSDIGNTGFNAVEGTTAGAGTGASIGAMAGGPVGAGIGAVIGGAIGGAAGANTLDATQYYSDVLKELDDKYGVPVGWAGQAVQDVRGGLGNIYGETSGKLLNAVGLGDLSRGIKGAISGINTGEMKKYGTSVAKDLAIKDLEKKYKSWLEGQGFENRLVASQSPEVLARTAALQDLLRRKG